MQLAYRHDERPGESYVALDGKKNNRERSGNKAAGYIEVTEGT